MALEREKENFYHEALVVLLGLGIKSNNKVMMSNGVAITAQEYLKEKLRYGENLPGTTDKITVENLKERCDRYEKALTEIYNLHYCLNPNEKGKCGLIAHDALATIGENDEKV